MRFKVLALLAALAVVGSLAAKPVTILVSIDGCRWDYPELHQATFLQELAASGTRVERLVPSYPSKTFPNHYTLVTGLRPSEHGIIQNKFYDHGFDAWFAIGDDPAAREGRWWGGEPIWNTIERQGGTAACMFWPGSEAPINDRYPSEWLPYDHKLPNDARIDQVVTWVIAPNSPDLVTLYFSAVDSAGHDFGPESPQTRDALLAIDAALRTLRDRLIETGRWSETTLIITADHGMTPVSGDRIVELEELLDLDDVTIDFSGACTGLMLLHPEAATHIAAAINRLGKPIRAYAKADVPARLHFSNNARIPDIVIIPELGWRVFTHKDAEKRRIDGWADGGDHGFDPVAPDMSAIFIVAGPGIEAGKVVPPTENIHVYNLLCALSHVKPAPNSGDLRLAEAVLPVRARR